MNLNLRRPDTGRSSFALAAAFASCLLLTVPSCRIPKLCCAERGPALPDTYNGVTSAESSAQIGWCEFFADPTLTSLLSESLAGNQELKILTQDIRIANYEIMARKGDYLPFVNIGGSAGLDKSSRFTRNGAVEDQLLVAPGKPFPEPLPNFLLAADVSWEIDIWRKLRNARDAASLRYLGTRDGQNYVVTRLIAEVAEDYYELMALDNRLLALNRTIEIQEQSLETAKALKEGARGTELAVQRFQAEVRKNQSERLIIQQEIVEVENRINFNCGRYPQTVARNSAGYLDLQLHALSLGVPAQLLQNRADIRQAERELQAAGLDVRVARARFYPSLNIRAGVGYEAFNTNYLFMSPESLVYNAVGELVAPVINKKAIRAAYLSANAEQLQRVYEYQRTVLNAYTEVINQVAKVENYGQSIEIKKQQLQALEDSVDTATKLFQNARAEYIDVLLSQRDLQDAKMVLIETKQQQLAAVVNAYQALGGGGNAGTMLVASNTIAPPELRMLPEPGDEPPMIEVLPSTNGPPPGFELLPTPSSAPSEPKESMLSWPIQG
ncbi:Outer membrane protein OprM precursor [Pirellulimonas nuda]|uniref:Outer membrane protein OprM n=1 Tax=Pirellulimonas nuda TaxID=2528009 RepID=A0A518DCM5_9BACT|nr:TolC family protein [Pirellulimonas nuda]QDU89210.1 Outer membrane protein OprM precursor [Pirellulimonas nuda]